MTNRGKNLYLLLMAFVLPAVFIGLSDGVFSKLDTPAQWRTGAVVRFVCGALLVLYMLWVARRIIKLQPEPNRATPKGAKYVLAGLLAFIVIILFFVACVPYGKAMFDTAKTYQGGCMVYSGRVETTHFVARNYGLTIPGYAKPFGISGFTYHQLAGSLATGQKMTCQHDIRLQYVPSDSVILTLTILY